jgi:hypothetical protein
MPHKASLAEIHLSNITACLKPAVTLLNELNQSFGTPFLPAIAGTVLSLVTAGQVSNGWLY